MHHLVLPRIQLDRHRKVSRDFGCFRALDKIMWKIREDTATVRGLPPEELEWKLVGVVVSQFLSEEIIDARLLVYLGELPVVAEGVRVPSHFDVDTKFFLEVAFPEQKLPDLRFTVRH